MSDPTSESSSAEPAPTPAVKGEPPSRAGRNVPLATAVGALLGGLVVVTVYKAPLAFVALVGFAFAIAVLELISSLATVGIRAPRWPLLAGTLAIVPAAYFGKTSGLLVAFALTVLAVVFWRVLAGPDGSVRDLTAGVWIAAYAPLMAGFPVLMVGQPHGAQRVIVYVATTVSSDIGGFALGVVFGRHPMAPRPSTGIGASW